MSVKPSYEKLEKRLQELENTLLQYKKEANHNKKQVELLSLFLENSPFYTYIKEVSDEASKVLYASKNFIDMTGIASSKMVGRTMDELFPKEFADKITNDDIEVFSKGHNIELKEELNDRHYWTYKFPVIQGDKRYLGGYTIDITDLETAEKKLLKGEQRIQSIFRAAPTGIGLVVNRNLVEVNDRFIKMVGYSKEELLGQNARILYPSDEHYEYVGKEKYRQISTYGTGTVETQFKRKDGEIIDVLMSSTPLDQSDWTKGVSFTALDISERKKAEKELIEAHQRFLTVLDSIDATIYVADMETYEILFMNERMKKDFGHDYTGELCWKVFRGESSPCSHCSNDKLTDPEGKPTEGYVWQDKNPILNKTYINCDRAIHWTNGRLVRIQIATDISELKKMEEQLRQAQKMESVGRLAGGVAHDFNNMLSIILGNIELIMDDIEPSSPFINNLVEAQKAAQRSTNLTRQLLAFARKQTISPKILDLNKTIAGMLKMLRRLIGEDIDLIWRPEKKIWPVKMDPSQIDQILANLCVNARDAIKDVGKITIETSCISLDAAYCKKHKGFKPGDYVVLSVIDSGCGMDTETAANVFEPFYTTKELGKGTGLGLATVYGIVKQNYGFINVDSEINEGTSFKIYLPKYLDESQTKDIQTADVEVMKGNETILLVEDETAILQMTQMTLERMGYKVLAANSPYEAIQISKTSKTKIHLLMTDVVMPSMNGRDLADELSSNIEGLKCLFMSGYTEDVIAHRGILDEGLNFISKPFSKLDLSIKLRAILD